MGRNFEGGEEEGLKGGEGEEGGEEEGGGEEERGKGFAILEGEEGEEEVGGGEKRGGGGGGGDFLWREGRGLVENDLFRSFFRLMEKEE